MGYYPKIIILSYILIRLVICAGVNKKTIIGSIVGGCLLLVLSFIILCLWIRRKKRARAIAAANGNFYMLIHSSYICTYFGFNV